MTLQQNINKILNRHTISDAYKHNMLCDIKKRLEISYKFARSEYELLKIEDKIDLVSKYI